MTDEAIDLEYSALIAPLKLEDEVPLSLKITDLMDEKFVVQLLVSWFSELKLTSSDFSIPIVTNDNYEVLSQ